MITPVDIENLQFKKVALGYSVEEVDEFLEKLLVDYEKVFKDNVKLNSKITTLEDSVKRYDKMEETIKTSILLAEKAAKETKALAEEQADNILDRAELEAEKLIAKAFEEKNQVEKEIYALKKQYQLLKAKMRVLLEGQLDLLEDDTFDINMEMEEEAVAAPVENDSKENEQAEKLKALGDLFEETE